VGDHILAYFLHIPLVGANEVFHLVHVHKVFAYVLGFFPFCNGLHGIGIGWDGKGNLEKKIAAPHPPKKIAGTTEFYSKQYG
jgi:hypothetical protein